MKFKAKQWLAALLTLTLLPLAGCGYFNAKAEKVQPSMREQQCLELKTTLTHNEPSAIGKQNPTQQAEAMKLYDKYECDKLESN